MQISFRYTDEEFKESKRLNHLLGVPKWKSYGLAAICLIPSLLLVWISGSTISLVAFALMVFVVAILSFVSALHANADSDPYEHVMTFTKKSKHEKLSHSEFETDWRTYDEFYETPNSFVFRRLERHSLIPKRVIPPEQLEAFRGYAALVDEPANPADEPVPLFARLFSEPAQKTVYRFEYHPDDLAKALADPLTAVKDTTPSAKKKGSRLRAAWLALVVTVLFFFIWAPPNDMPWTGSWTLIQFGTLFAAIVMPFLFIRCLNAWFRSRAQRRPNSVPPDENQMCLMNAGWAIGGSNSAIFYDWRDIDCFYQNEHCFGFKTVNDLIQIIPKRIFGSSTVAQSFLNQAIGLRREHRRTFEDNQVAVETGNPYQPPTL